MTLLTSMTPAVPPSSIPVISHDRASLILPIAANEFRYMFWSLQTLVTFSVFFAIAFLLTANAGEFQTFAPGGKVLANAPYIIADVLLKLSVAAFFVVPPYIANAVLKDVDSQFDAVLFSMPIKKTEYLIGRFMGAFGALVIAFSGGAVGMLLGTFWPWAEPELLGATELSHYLLAYLGVVVPSLFAISGILFAVAVLSRSLILTQVIAFGLFVVYLIVDISNVVPPIFDPFMIDIFREQTQYWTAAERNAKSIQFTQSVWGNRLLWVSIAIAFILLALKRFSFQTIGKKTKTDKARKLKKQSLSFNKLKRRNKTELAFRGVPFWNNRTILQQLKTNTWFEMKAVLISVPFMALMAISILLLVVSLGEREVLYGVNAHPVTRLMIDALASLKLPLLIVAVFYSAEIVWRERTAKCHEIIDALPVANWVFVTSKLLALCLVLMSIMMMGAVMAVGFQLVDGSANIEWDLYLERALFFNALPLIYIAVLTFLFQVLAKNRYLGMMMFAVFMTIVATSRDTFGVEHPLLSFVFPAVGAPMSDMNGDGRFMALGYSIRVYWGAIAGLFLILTYLLWPRGTLQSLKLRLKQIKNAASFNYVKPAVLCILVGLCAGGFIYYNTNVLNDYITDSEIESFMVDYEKRYRQYENLPMPRIVEVNNQVDIFPNQYKVETRSSHLLLNKANQDIVEVHVAFPPSAIIQSVNLQNAREVKKEDDPFNYYFFPLDKPLKPGETLQLTFETLIQQKGFPHKNPDTSIAANGTFILNNQITPYIGFNPDYLIKDNRVRRKHGLDPISHRPKLEAHDQYTNNVHRQDSDFILLESTVSTVADQTVVASGYLDNQWVEDGRRYFHFKMDKPVRNFYSYQSAKYEIAKTKWRDVDINVFYHKTHSYNIDRMLAGAKDSLAYFSQEFSPYQYRQLNIAEFPDYRRFAQSLVTTIPYSEGLGFIADVKPGDLDMPYYVTAHEVAHQWWGFQVVAANTQGDGFIHETLSQYSALLMLEQKYGQHQLRKYLKYELDRYLSARSDDAEGELPLYRVEKQPHIYYRKGSLAMYMLRDYLGVDLVNRTLRKLIAQRAYSSQPYTLSTDFLKILKAEAGPAHQKLIIDLFEKITLFDVKLLNSQVRPTEDGRYRVKLDVEVAKLYAQKDGTENKVALDIPVDIGLFFKSPADDSFEQSDVIFLEKRKIQGDRVTLELITDQQPVYAGIDPYNKLIDRNSDDNLGQVEVVE